MLCIDLEKDNLQNIENRRYDFLFYGYDDKEAGKTIKKFKNG